MKKIVKGKKFNLLKVKEHILVHAGMLVELMRILHYNRILEKALAPFRHDSHVVLKRNTVVMKNYGLAVRIALRHHNDDIAPLKDYIGYGVEGLIKAVEGFKPEKGSKFSSYAGACIANTVMRSVVENEIPIRLPEHHVIEKKRESREETRVYVEKGIEPSSSSRKKRLVPEIAFSVDDCKEGDDGDKLASRFVSENILSPEDYILQKSKEALRVRAITLLKENLSEHEWFILRGGFCFETEEPMTLRRMGDALGLSHENVRRKMKLSLGKAQRVLSRNSLTCESFF